MRVSAHSILKGGKGVQPQDRPREGTILGNVYDELIKGGWVDINKMMNNPKSKGRMLDQLRDYGLEICSKKDPSYVSRSIRGGNKPTYLYRCTGIWDNDNLRTLEDVRVALDHCVLRDDKGVM